MLSPIVSVDHRQVKAWLLQHRYCLNRLRGSVGDAAARFEKMCYSKLCHRIRCELVLDKTKRKTTASVLCRIRYLAPGFRNCRENK